MISGEIYQSADVFQLASQVSGKKAPFKVPHQILKIMSYIVKPFDSVMPEIFTSEGLRVIAGVTYWGDNTKAKRELGFNPRPLREGWAETVRHEMKMLGMS
jgi:dihydroflavonol-4-reductase